MAALTSKGGTVAAALPEEDEHHVNLVEFESEVGTGGGRR